MRWLMSFSVRWSIPTAFLDSLSPCTRLTLSIQRVTVYSIATEN